MTFASNHLSPEEVVDLLDDELAPARAAHSRSCPSCAEKVAAVRQLAGMVKDDHVPEPSPLFWERFSARVATSIRSEPAPRPHWVAGFWMRRLLPFAATAVMVLGLVAGLLPKSGLLRSSPGPGAASQAAAAAAAEESARFGLPSDDASWSQVAEFMDSVGGDDAESGLVEPGPGSAEEAALGLSSPEQQELVRLLKDEIGRESGSSVKAEGGRQ